MLHNYGHLQIDAQNLKKMWRRVERQFTADVRGYHVDRRTAERSYGWFEDAVEQFMRDATKAGYFDPITGRQESELERHRPQKD
jgi:hypothetical protein